jgi:hypothetical protein
LRAAARAGAFFAAFFFADFVPAGRRRAGADFFAAAFFLPFDDLAMTGPFGVLDTVL